jgi:CO/xanthine dehydrogenase FAD-binding subunit
MRETFLPSGMDELWSMMDRYPEAALFAGGTDLFVRLRTRRYAFPVLIGLERIEELHAIQEDALSFRIGAGATFASLLAHPAVRAHFPVLISALNRLGSPQIRNMGTIGGNICTASPAGDTLPPLYVLQAEVEIQRPPVAGGGSRTVPISSFIAGPGQTALKKGEIAVAIHIRKPEASVLHHFEKVGQRKGMAIAVASLAALLKTARDGTVQKARLAWGSVGPTIITSPEIDRFLEGRKITPHVAAEAAALARKAVNPINDIRATADYRRNVSGNLLLRLPLLRLPDD